MVENNRVFRVPFSTVLLHSEDLSEGRLIHLTVVILLNSHLIANAGVQCANLCMSMPSSRPQREQCKGGLKIRGQSDTC